MTWKLTVRGSSDRPIAAEYLCPVHGRFTLDVDRDANGDPPAEQACPVQMPDRDWGISDPPVIECGATSPYVISAPARAKVRVAEVVRGGYQKAEVPTWTDTTNLGEGQDLDDWHDDRDKVWERHREDAVKELERELG